MLNVSSWSQSFTDKTLCLHSLRGSAVRSLSLSSFSFYLFLALSKKVSRQQKKNQLLSLGPELTLQNLNKVCNLPALSRCFVRHFGFNQLAPTCSVSSCITSTTSSKLNRNKTKNIHNNISIFVCRINIRQPPVFSFLTLFPCCPHFSCTDWL